ncbi:MAG TPA: adenylate/guanylate cyclase domain-containing protein [Candidatus Cybelea sp.]|nr:adenylate/guanylate cyclase domain-containing protein [Candidatus Cybelea sp.]
MARADQPVPPGDDTLRRLSAAGGERKHVTVLFADIRDSTSLIAGSDPEQALRRIEPVLRIMKDAVHRFDGVVVKIQGDGIMALFGAPVPLEDHAVRGCLAALAMREAVAKGGDATVAIRVGLHTGEVVVRSVRNDLSDEYDAVGLTVHLASRMEQMSAEAGILLTAETVAAARQFIEVRTLGLHSVRGFSSPIEIFTLTGLKHAPASEHFRSSGRRSPLFGRDGEFLVLEQELAKVKAGEGRVVGVVGEAGIGKSRLCFEFAEMCRRSGVRVFEARALAHGRATPFQPVLELLRDYFDIRQQDTPEEARRRIAARLRPLAEDFDAALPILHDFLGVAAGAQPAPKLDPSTRKARLLDMVRRIVRSPRRGEAAVVIVEDLHWIDASSDEFVDAMVDAVVGTSTLLLVNFRPGYTGDWMQRSHYRQLNLTPLGVTAADALLRDLLGTDGALVPLEQAIAARAQGNPFFLEELVKALHDHGDIEGERGAYRLLRTVSDIPLPPTVQAVVGARIDRLNSSAKHVLQTASVIGREVAANLLESVAGMPAEQLEAAMQQLRRAEMLQELPPFRDGLHAFRHPIIQEVAYRSMLEERRRGLHAAVAQAIEAQKKGRTEEYAGLLAYHWEAAGQAQQAAQQHMRAALWLGANDAARALESWMKVCALLRDQPPAQNTNYLRMVACGQVVNFGWRVGLTAAAVKSYFDEAQALAAAANDLRANTMILAAYGRILATSGSADDYVAKIQEAEALAVGVKEASLPVTIKAVLCHAYRMAGRLTDALAANTQALERVQDISKFDRQMLGFDIETWLHGMRGQTLVMLGRGDEARPYLDRVLQIEAEKIDAVHHFLPSAAYIDLAWFSGDAVLAGKHVARAKSLAEKSGSPYLEVYAAAYGGLAEGIAGNYAQAVADIGAALAMARQRNAGLENEARMLADLAEMQRLGGDLTGAMATAEEALRVAELRHARLPECQTRLCLAAIMAATDGPPAAAAMAHQLDVAQSLVTTTGAVVFQPRIDAIRKQLRDAQRKLRGSIEHPVRNAKKPERRAN